MSYNKMDLSRTQVGIVCLGFKKDKDIEAIKKEARSYYLQYKKDRPDLDIKFISLEQEMADNEEIYDQEYDIHYWGYNFQQLLPLNQQFIIHFFADSLEGYFLIEKNYDPKVVITLYTVTGINGLRDYAEQYLRHLRHAIDVGNLYLFVESTISQEQFAEKGLYAKKMLPRVNISKEQINKEKSSQFTVGFASAPLSRETWEDRGINLLIPLMKRFPDVRFKLAWRNNSYSEVISLLESEGLVNYEIHNGFIDMTVFYKDIDVMIAPFASLQNNHSCPLSIVESIVLGIPVLVTELVGIHDIVHEYEVGLVAKSNVEDLEHKLKTLREFHSRYQENAEKVGYHLFGAHSTERISYLQLYEMISKQAPSPTLDQWNKQLHDNGKYLVMTREGMAAYYNDDFVAKSYDEFRFSEYPMRTYDRLERKAVTILINQYIQSSKENQCLDIASGEGRILRELLNYGSVTAVENSRFMISVSTSKLNNPNDAKYLNYDFFDFATEDRYDLITAFRFVRHFDYRDRRILYEKLHKLLNEDGIVIVDFPDKQAETQLRDYHGWGSFHVYDVFWNEFEIVDELSDNGFMVLGQIPIGQYLMPKGTLNNEELPLSRVVCFTKK